MSSSCQRWAVMAARPMPASSMCSRIMASPNKPWACRSRAAWRWSNSIEPEEMKLLEEARRLMPRLPFDDVDLLIVDEMGKNLSGAGLDTNVIRRDADGSFIKPGLNAPRRIYVRSLHPYSYGNAVGLGMADFIHERLLRAMDPQATWINAMTALMPANARVPMHFPTDREALEMAMQTMGSLGPRAPK